MILINKSKEMTVMKLNGFGKMKQYRPLAFLYSHLFLCLKFIMNIGMIATTSIVITLNQLSFTTSSKRVFT